MDKLKISMDTKVRIAVFIFAWLNALLSKFFGLEIPYIGEEFIATVIAAVTSVWVGWKDNDITQEAIERKVILKEIEGEDL